MYGILISKQAILHSLCLLNMPHSFCLLISLIVNIPLQRKHHSNRSVKQIKSQVGTTLKHSLSVCETLFLKYNTRMLICNQNLTIYIISSCNGYEHTLRAISPRARMYTRVAMYAFAPSSTQTLAGVFIVVCNVAAFSKKPV